MIDIDMIDIDIIDIDIGVDMHRYMLTYIPSTLLTIL